jgi:hypothetical protein
VVFLQRQLSFANDSAGRVADMVGQLAAILVSVADASPGWGQNLLGAIGLSSPGSGDPISIRGKFLARALAIFLRSLLTTDKGALIEKMMEGGEGEERKDLKSLVLECGEVKQQLEKLASLQRSKAFVGLADLMGWVVIQVGLILQLKHIRKIGLKSKANLQKR